VLRIGSDWKDIVGAEIGVYDGSHTWSLLNKLDIKKIYLIDPYIPYFGAWPKRENSRVWLLRAERRARTIANEKYPGKCEFIYENSNVAVKRFKDESLDFVYIDADHRYEFVKEDIRIWHEKVKIGGVMGGHDYGPHQPGVPQAVDEWGKKKKIKIATFFAESKNQDWMYKRTK